MHIEITLENQACAYQVEAGTLLSELLQTDQAVWLEGKAVDPQLMLAAQAHGRKIELKSPRLAPPLQANMLVPEPSRC